MNDPMKVVERIRNCTIEDTWIVLEIAEKTILELVEENEVLKKKVHELFTEVNGVAEEDEEKDEERDEVVNGEMGNDE